MPTAPRRPWLAGLLSLLLPGLGHLYVGRPGTGILYYLSVLFGVMAFSMLAMVSFLPAPLNVSSILMPLIVYGFALKSAVRLAKEQGPTYQPKIYNKWYIYLAVCAAASIASDFYSDVLREFVVKAYKIPSGAMIPTLLIGDHIFVDKLAYHFQDPVRGDVIVFKYPEDETKTFDKRVIGLPGDRIEIRNKVVYINGEALDDKAYTQRIDPGIIDRAVNPRDNFGPVTVPEKSYFVMGDNRDQSLDSRFWGYVERSKIIGKVKTIYWSWSGRGKLSDWVRWKRIGQHVT